MLTRHQAPLPILGFLVVTAAAPVAQTEGVAATYRLGGETRQVSTVELALELGRRERHRPRGQDALKHLIDKTLVSEAAEREGVAPTRAEIHQRIDRVREALAAQGIELERFLAAKNLTRRAFEQDYIGLSVAHERLVMKSAEIEDPSKITPALLQLWLDEARSKAGVVDDPKALPPGIVARIGDSQLTLADLGDVLVENATRETRERGVTQIVVRALLEAEARKRGLDATPVDIDAEIARRRRLIEADPSFGGVPYEDLLKAQGTSLEELRSSPVIRAQVYRSAIVDAAFPDVELDQRIASDRDAMLIKYGPRRHVHAIQVRAADPPTEFVPLDFEQARERAVGAIERIREDGMAFPTAARIYSDDPATKVQGGDLGMVGHDDTERLPRPVLDAAFALEPFTVSEPIRADDGWYLVRVTEVEAAPTDAILRALLRDDLGAELVRDLLASANIELIDA